MSNFNWCHGPECHKEKTVDRVRGVKGSKVLRTRKIKLNNWNKDWWTKYFCGNGCFNQFVNRNLERVVAIAPRPDALETPIKDPQKTTHSSQGHFNNYSWTNTEIKVDESRQIEQDYPITERYIMTKTIKAEYLPGGAKRQELINQVPDYLRTPGIQSDKHMFCLEVLKLTETEYLEALNKATNGELVRSAWN